MELYQQQTKPSDREDGKRMDCAVVEFGQENQGSGKLHFSHILFTSALFSHIHSSLLIHRFSFFPSSIHPPSVQSSTCSVSPFHIPFSLVDIMSAASELYEGQTSLPFTSTELEAFHRFHAYPWDEDKEFQAGLRTITQAQSCAPSFSELLKMKQYYFSTR